MSAEPTNTRRDLWGKAVDSLPAAVIKSLDPARTAKRDVANAALKLAQEKHAISTRKRWRIKKSGSGEDIIVRDVIGKIIHWIRRFREVGDAAMQYDSGYAALPWAAVRFLLQVAINENEVHSGMVEDLELVARLMARFNEFERLYPADHSNVHDQLESALVAAYVSILEFLAKAVRYFSESTRVRVLKSLTQSVDENRRSAILALEAEVMKQASLVDAGRLVNIEAQVFRLADMSLTSQKAVEQQRHVDVLN